MPDSVLIQNEVRPGLSWDLHTIVSVEFCNGKAQVFISTAWRLVPSDEAIDEVTTTSSSSDEEVGAGDHGNESEDTTSISSDKEIGAGDDGNESEGTTSGSSEGETGAGGRGSGSGKGKSSKKKPGKGTGKITIKSGDTNWPSDVPDDFPTCHKDWRTDDVLRGDVTIQGPNEVCWAVSLRESIEAALNIRNRRMGGRNRHPNLSAQHLINNVRKLEKGAMRRYEIVENFLVNHGLVKEDLCEYTSNIGENGCAHAMPEQVTRIRGLQTIKRKQINEAELIKLVAQRPVMVEMNAYESLLRFKGPGIYRGANAKEAPKPNRHALLLIGYGTTDDGLHYWIVKNSYGTLWGDGGYGKIIRQCSPKNTNDSSLFVRIRYPEI